MSRKIDTSKIHVLKDTSVYGVPVRLEEMPLATFLSHPEVDTQRDTEGRADRALHTHLKNDSPFHGLAFIGELPNGKRYILDANTRRYLWEQGKKTPLENILAYTVKCNSLEDARNFYFQLDSHSAVDRNTDVAYGLLRSQHVLPGSELVRKSGYLTGLRKAFPIIKPTTLIGQSATLLSALDDLGLTRRGLPAGVLGAFFLSTLRYGAKVQNFWKDVVLSRGTATEEGRTPAAALSYRIDVARASNKLTGDRNVTHLMDVSLFLVEAYLRDAKGLIADNSHESLKRDSFVKSMLTDNAELQDWFVKPHVEKPAKVKAAKAEKAVSATKGAKSRAKPIASKAAAKPAKAPAAAKTAKAGATKSKTAAKPKTAAKAPATKSASAGKSAAKPAAKPKAKRTTRTAPIASA